MLPQTASDAHCELDDFLEAYETAQAEQGTADLADFLPATDHPQYGAILRELVRVDMEYACRRGEPVALAEYVQRFPTLADDPRALEDIAFEEKRLRAQTAAVAESGPEMNWGDQTDSAGFLSQLMAQREREIAREGQTGSSLVEAARSYRHFRSQAGRAESVETWANSFTENNAHVRLFGELHRSDPAAAKRLAEAAVRMPAVGSEFLGFRLVAELGEGAFARVYLAEQPDLANRWVALKVAPDLHGEPQRLAQLQHTHIVPVYSTHRVGPLQAVCMPYFGSMTLADLVRDLEGRVSLPLSGKAVVSTLRERKHATLRDTARATVANRRPGTLVQLPSPDEDLKCAQAPPSEVEAVAGLQVMEGRTYIQTVLTLGLQLADGLAHAHERGILHRDLKPANVLLTDDGQPMLLDFNLAEDTKRAGDAARASIGGTLPYMAPEHLEAFQGGRRTVDARSDVYALGVILYELLTGRHPFPLRRGALDDVLPLFIADRQEPLPDPRRINPAISPAIASLLRHCLEPDPAQRYQSAGQLREDLERHLAHLPLRYALEPSWFERFAKYRRRHPRLTSSLTVGSAAAAVLLVLALAFVGRGRRLAQLEALEDRQIFREEMKAVQYVLNAQAVDRDNLHAGLDECRRVLSRYAVLDNPAWIDQPASALLPAEERERLRQDVGELLLLLARSTELTATPTDAKPLQVALVLNTQAEASYGSEQAPRALWAQRADLLERLGKPNEARQLVAKAVSVALRTARDHYLVATEHAAHGRFRDAIPFLDEATRLDPQSYWAWFLLGYCHDGLARDGKAEACYTTCVALAPRSPWAYFNRGVVYLRQQDHRRAVADFDRVLQLRPEMSDAYVNRALARQGLKRFTAAAQDLTRALELGTAHTRVYFLRARARELAGDREGAAQDRAEGLRREPADEKSWIARGVVRLGHDNEGALGDFSQALQLNPRSRAALQNKAHVLAERLDRTAEAVTVLEAAAAHYPDAASVFASRGVLQARLGRRRAAHADAEAALRRDGGPATLYQVAGIYALTSKLEPEDCRDALRLLSAALRTGYGAELLEDDRDLDPIRGHPEFRRLAEAGRVLAPRSPVARP